METPSGYTNNLGGAGTLGPYGSQSECESVNSAYFYGNGTCICHDSSSGESSGGLPGLGGGNPFDPLFQPIGEALGQAMTNAILGDPQQAAHEAALRRQRQQAEQLEQARRAEAERLAQEQRRRKFAEAQDRMLGQVKGLDGARLDGERSASTTLVVKEVGDIFGTRAVTPVAAGDAVEVAGLTLKEIDFNPSVPPIGPEIETPESKALRERVRQEISAYQALVDLGRQQLAEHQAAKALVKKAEQELEAVRRAAEEARNRKLALETSPPAVPTPPSDTSIQDALAALEKAEQATTEAERALAEARHGQDTIEHQMKETLQTLERAPRPPGWQPDPASTPP